MIGFLPIVSAISALSPFNAEIVAAGHLVEAACFLITGSYGRRWVVVALKLFMHSLQSVVSMDVSHGHLQTRVWALGALK